MERGFSSLQGQYTLLLFRSDVAASLRLLEVDYNAISQELEEKKKAQKEAEKEMNNQKLAKDEKRR